MRHFVEQKLGKLFARPLPYDSNVSGREGLAQPGGKLLGRLWGRPPRVLHVKDEHGVVRGLGRRQGFPGPIDQLLPPALQEHGLTIGSVVGWDSPLDEVGGQRLGLCLQLPVIIGNKVNERRFHIIAEAPGRRVRPAEIPAEEAYDKLLEQIQGGIFVVERAAEISINGAAVALD
jgi:hypothetical protein